VHGADRSNRYKTLPCRVRQAYPMKSVSLSVALVSLLSLSPLSGHTQPQVSTASTQPTPAVRAAGYSYTNPGLQPAQETLDLSAYSRIRDEGFNHSRIMDYATALLDGIGPRLTGSPNLAKANAWTRDQLVAMGCANAHLESWGDFGMGWRQVATSVDMVAPDTGVFISQATPWSPATPGSVSGSVIAVPYLHDEKDFDAWKGGKRLMFPSGGRGNIVRCFG